MDSYANMVAAATTLQTPAEAAEVAAEWRDDAQRRFQSPPRDDRNRRNVRALTQHHSLEDPMRKILLALAATAVMAVPMATVVKAEDSTTVIKHDGDKKTVIKKEHDLNVVPVPHEEEHTTVIKKEHD